MAYTKTQEQDQMTQKTWTWPEGFVERSLEIIKKNNRDSLDSKDSTVSLKVVVETRGKHTKKERGEILGKQENDSMSYHSLTLQDGSGPERGHSLLMGEDFHGKRPWTYPNPSP